MLKLRSLQIALLCGALLIGAGVTTALKPSSLGAETSTAGNSFKQLYICGSDGKSICKIGAVGPGGGTIFYVDYHDIYQGFDYLEAAPASYSNVTGATATWCSNTTTDIQMLLTPWSSRAVGIGKSNTKIMLENCSSGAAVLVQKYNNSSKATKHDWFLPSLGELMLMSQNMQGLGALEDSDYWSSSGYSSIGGWVESVGHGYQGSATKDSILYVRPVREF